MQYNKLNNLTGWAVFAIALVVYLLSVSPTASFWDCGEFIAVSNELEVPHPPGAPIYLLFGRLFAIFAPNAETVAFMVNLVSVITSAFTALFIFWTTTILAKKILAPKEVNPSTYNTLLILFAGAVAGLTCTFTSSVWFNAVEAEVYAFSSFFTAIVVWLIFKWEARADEPDNLRWLILIFYLTGVSIGVHLLNLLAIPALVMVYYFRKYKFSWVGVGTALAASIVILGFMNSFTIKHTFTLAESFEKILVGGDYMVNGQLDGTSTGLGLPSGTGALTFFILLFGGIAYGIWWSQKNKKVLLNTAFISVAMIYIGLASYSMILIRANKSTPINENDPSDILYFVKYMKREQYGDWPILYGPMYNANAQYEETDVDKYIKLPGHKRYVIDGKEMKIKYTDGERFLPRMHSSQHYDRQVYGYKQFVRNKGGDPDDPRDDKPTGADNMRFLMEYQIAHMYIRYFLWNFVGRESDQQDSQWESGINYHIKDKKNMPENLAKNPSRNHYFFLPLLLGLLGMYWHFTKHKRDASVIALLFFFTGLAIVLYLNQTPEQPRERDYSYAGSFQTFTIWIGLGVVALAELLKKFLGDNTPAIVGSVCLLAVPVNMGAQNFHDHSRAGNYVAPDSAYNLLMSVGQNGILFTNGDNDTFPLWYLQEVEGVRTDVRIINLSLLNTDWYIDQLKTKINNSDSLPVSLPATEYVDEKNAITPLGRKTIYLPVDKEALLKNKVVTEAELANVIAPVMIWEPKATYGGSYIRKQDMMIINLIENIAKNGWNRPIHFAITIPPSSYMNLTEYFRLEGQAYRFVPIKYPKGRPGLTGGLDKERMYHLLADTFRFRNLDKPGVYYDHNIQRMTANARGNFIRLAVAYADEAANLENQLNVGKLNKMPQSTQDSLASQIAFAKQRTEKVLDMAQVKISDDVIRTDAQMLAQYANLYAQVGKKDKFQKLAATARDRATKDLAYSRKKGKGESMSSDDEYDTYALYTLALAYSSQAMDKEAREVADLFVSYTNDQSIYEQIKRERLMRGAQLPAEEAVVDSGKLKK